MKKLCIRNHIITFEEDGFTPETPDDFTLVTRLLESSDVTDEIKALARMVLVLWEEREEKDHGSINRRPY